MQNLKFKSLRHHQLKRKLDQDFVGMSRSPFFISLLGKKHNVLQKYKITIFEQVCVKLKINV